MIGEIYIPTTYEVLSATKAFAHIIEDEQELCATYGADGVYWRENGYLINAMMKHPSYNGDFRIGSSEFEVFIRRKDICTIREFADYVSSIPGANKDATNFICRICSYLEKRNIRSVDEEMIATIGTDDLHLGQKISRLVGRIGKAYGLSEHKDFVWNVCKTNRYAYEGYVDRGWNYQFAVFCDAYYTQTARQRVWVSVNPEDFSDFSCTWGETHYHLPGVVIYRTDEENNKICMMCLSGMSTETPMWSTNETLKDAIHDEHVRTIVSELIADIKGIAKAIK